MGTEEMMMKLLAAVALLAAIATAVPLAGKPLACGPTNSSAIDSLSPEPYKYSFNATTGTYVNHYLNGTKFQSGNVSCKVVESHVCSCIGTIDQAPTLKLGLYMVHNVMFKSWDICYNASANATALKGCKGVANFAMYRDADTFPQQMLNTHAHTTTPSTSTGFEVDEASVDTTLEPQPEATNPATSFWAFVNKMWLP